MAADVYSAIGEYLRKINDNIITPVLVPLPPGKRGQQNNRGDSTLRPGRLALFQRVLMTNYRNAVAVFEPAHQGCSSTSQCDQGEECVDGVCKPVAASARFSQWSCRVTSECDQGEECIDGVCVPVPWDLGFEAVSVKGTPPPSSELDEALTIYASKIQAVIVNGLGKDKSRLFAVRAMLLQSYADACKAAGKKTKPCDGSSDCDEDSECVDGICVPIPFRLVFRAVRG